jgi:hypothetical protein
MNANKSVTANFAIATASFPDLNKWYTIACKNNTKQCLDVYASYTNGTALDLWPHVNVNEEFKFVNAGNGYYSIVCRGNTAYAANVTGGVFASGTKMQIWSVNGGNSQKFKPVSDGAGYYMLQSYNAAYSIDNGGSTANETMVKLGSTSTSNNNQKWLITAIGSLSKEQAPSALNDRQQARPLGIISMGKNVFAIVGTAGTHYAVYNLSGKQVMQGEVSHEQARIDLSGFMRGAYLITVSSGNGKLIQKMIVK